MIKISSYQVYDNCVGDCVIDRQPCSIECNTAEDMEDYRQELWHRHRKDVEDYRNRVRSRKPKDKDITIYMTYKNV